MTMTILSAAYANAEDTAAVAQTQEAGAVLLSAADTPAAWAAMLAAVEPAPYQAPALPRVVTPLAFMDRLAPETQAAITAAAAASPAVLLWLLRLTGAREVDLDSAETQGGVAALQAAGLLTQEQAAALLG